MMGHHFRVHKLRATYSHLIGGVWAREATCECGYRISSGSAVSQKDMECAEKRAMISHHEWVRNQVSK